MPELPEVETIRRGLEKPLAGRRIASAKFTLPRLLLGGGAAKTAGRLQGQHIESVLRRGKYLVLELDRDSLIFHLGMTGQLTLARAGADEDSRFARTLTGLQKPLGAHPVDRHTHAVLRLDDGGRLQFRDPRTFGRIFLVEGRAWNRHPRLHRLGPEPLDLRVASFLAAHFPVHSARPIKALLLDQAFLAGVGNIYADEALFAAGIHPRRPARSLDAAERKCLLEAVRTVLRQGILNQGTTFSDYRQADGALGLHYEHLRAYGRGGLPCRTCGAALAKSLVAQRGTVFCPVCQPIPETRRKNNRKVEAAFVQAGVDKRMRRKHT
jgi:formamidopyrimidine-DNA glycosylase